MGMEGDKGEVVAKEAAAVEEVAAAYKVRTRTHQEAFPNMSPRWEDPNKIICRVLTIVALPQASRGDRQPAEADIKTQHTQTVTKYSTTGMCVILMDSTVRTATIQLHVRSGRWTTRRVSRATMHRHTSMQDMLQ